MKLFVAVLCLATIAMGRPQRGQQYSDLRNVPIVRYAFDGPNPDGSYQYNYETDNFSIKMAAVTSILSLLLLTTVVIRSVYCQYNLLDEEIDLEKREYDIPSIIRKIEGLLEEQKSLYTESDGIHLMHNDMFTNCLQKEITVNLQDSEREFRPSIIKNTYCINSSDGKHGCVQRNLKCSQKYEKVMIGWRKKGTGGPHCWDTMEYNRPAGCQCLE
ncbi:hypothetical protein CBL_06060 [Carabus blaptoides fortunei]